MNRTTKKKKLQLGEHPSTASARLIKDLLFEHVVKDRSCYRCGGPMSRADFSIDHKEDWLDSDDPVGRYFDLDNVSFSCYLCNVGAARRYAKPCGNAAAYRRGCRCDACKEAAATERRKYKDKRPYCAERRREVYLRTGK